uniref:Glutamine synthetase n=1 Tax=Lygus hesperus TaxID=30085 RepID=A0A0A9YTN7_LYGHE
MPEDGAAGGEPLVPGLDQILQSNSQLNATMTSILEAMRQQLSATRAEVTSGAQRQRKLFEKYDETENFEDYVSRMETFYCFDQPDGTTNDSDKVSLLLSALPATTFALAKKPSISL